MFPLLRQYILCYCAFVLDNIISLLYFPNRTLSEREVQDESLEIVHVTQNQSSSDLDDLIKIKEMSDVRCWSFKNNI